MKRLSTVVTIGIAVFAAIADAVAQNGITPTSVLIGQSAAFTGPAAQLGIQLRDGAKLWFDYVNASGGINGRRIELRSRDDKYESKLAAENTRKLIEEDDVFLLFAYVGTPTSQAALPIFTAARVPFVAPFTGAELLRTPFNRYVFNVRAGYYDETEKIVDQMTRSGLKRFAVFYQNDAYGQAGLEGVKRALARRNLEIAALGIVERNTTNVAEAVKTINAAQPEATVMISAYTSVAEFVRQMKVAGSGSQFCNVSFVGSTALADALGKDGNGVIIAQVVPFPVEPADADREGVPGSREARRQCRRQLLEPRGVHRSEGVGRRPASDGQGADSREIHCRDGVDDELRDRRLRRALLTRQPQRIAVRRPVDDWAQRQVHSLAPRCSIDLYHCCQGGGSALIGAF